MTLRKKAIDRYPWPSEALRTRLLNISARVFLSLYRLGVRLPEPDPRLTRNSLIFVLRELSPNRFGLSGFAGRLIVTRGAGQVLGLVIWESGCVGSELELLSCSGQILESFVARRRQNVN